MIQTIIRVGSIILLFIIISNIWSQKRHKEEIRYKNKK